MTKSKDIGITASGRIISRRMLSHSGFVTLDNKGIMTNVYVSRNIVCPGKDKTIFDKSFKDTKLGDTIAVVGDMVKVHGQPYLNAKELHFTKINF